MIVRESISFERKINPSLPDGLIIEKWLDLSNTKIISLPRDIVVKEEIYKDF